MIAGARAMVLLLAMVAGGFVEGADAEDLASGWSIGPVEAPAGEARSCAATKMTGTDRGIGFTRLSSGAEFLTVAVEGWSYPLGAEVSEQVKIGDGAAVTLEAYGQNNATVVKGTFTTDPALKSAKTVEIAIADKHLSFDITGLDQALTALEACMLPKA